MKILLISFICALTALHLRAGSNDAPPKLAIVAESPETAPAADLLTADFTKEGKVQLLERAEIDKVIHEQGLSAANQDHLKLGQLLGADGLLLLAVTREGTNELLNARLVAVKPGVVLSAESFPMPDIDLADWSSHYAQHVRPVLPKLTVLAKDAIPISVVNLRSAVQSDEAEETEQQLKLLAIQRLAGEPQLFVLERERMHSLTEEKDLKLDDSSFWSGSYLLDGVVDENGYSKETITLNARLTPSKGGAPLQIEVSGTRTNFSGLINQMAAKVIGALNVNPTVKEWNAADEAAQYFDEAQWALKWEVYSEAQMAADSAWVLGKHDMNCAMIRIKAYADANEKMIIGQQNIDRSIVDNVEESNREWIIRDIKKTADTHAGAIFQLEDKGIDSVIIDNYPNPRILDDLIRALNLYYTFSQTLAPDEPKVDSTWYTFGIENLTLASMGLQHFYLVPKSQGVVADKLAELRTLARSIAAWISQSPTVHDSYFTVDSDSDKQRRKLINAPNIYHCEANYGCFWQEKPEDCIALYRELLRSSAFSYLNEAFGSSPAPLHLDEPRGLDRPRLIAWNKDDRKNFSTLWGNFVQELSDSTNQHLQAESKLFKGLEASGLNETEIIDKYNEYWQHLKSGSHDIAAIEEQKQYLETFRAFNYDEFAKTFQFRDYSPSQSQTIASLLSAYRSNLVAEISQLGVTTFAEAIKNGRGDAYMADANMKQNLQTGIALVDKLQNKLGGILGRPSPTPVAPLAALAAYSEPTNSSQSTISSNTPAVHNRAATNSVFVKQFFRMPQDQLWVDVFVWPGEEASHGISNAKILTHRWRDGRLLFNLSYYCTYVAADGEGWAGGTLGAAALLNPESGHWDVISFPKGGMRDYGSVEFFHGKLYLVVDDQLIRGGNQSGHNESVLKYDLNTQQWEDLKIQIPGNFKQSKIHQGALQLFVVSDHLFAANFESIFEIMDDERDTHVMASTRRRPAASTLDLLDNLGSPLLYSGSNNSLRAIIGTGVYVWDEKDWKKESDLTCGGKPEVFEDSILFRSISDIPDYEPQTLWILKKNQPQPELALCKPSDRPVWAGFSQNIVPPQKPLWSFPEKDFLVRTAEGSFKSDLYFLIDHSLITTVDGHKTAMEQDGYHAKLVCLSRDCPKPITIPLKFDKQQGPLPIENLYRSPWNPWNNSGKPNESESWLFFADNYLFVGEDGIEGVWVIPIGELKSAVAAQKQIQLDKNAQEIAQANASANQTQMDNERIHKDLLSKYDLNHNGIIDPDEKEASLDDPAFITFELDKIDANHNGWLDADELAYFDANTNKTLEPNEQAGIDIAQRLLAGRLLKKYDANGDGFLDRQEFGVLLQSSMAIGAQTDPIQRRFAGPPVFPDVNHDGRIDIDELETFLKAQTRAGLRLHGKSGMATLAAFNQARRIAKLPADPREMFKMVVEAYWQNPGSGTNGTTSGHP